jgi:hypothetical protein
MPPALFCRLILRVRRKTSLSTAASDQPPSSR